MSLLLELLFLVIVLVSIAFVAEEVFLMRWDR